DERKRRRDPAASVDYKRQEGIFQIVIVLRITSESELPRKKVSENLDPGQIRLCGDRLFAQLRCPQIESLGIGWDIQAGQEKLSKQPTSFFQGLSRSDVSAKGF